MTPTLKSSGNKSSSAPRSSQLLAALTCLAGALTYVTLSNAWRFHKHLHLQQKQQEQSIRYAASLWGQDAPSLDAVAAIVMDHPSHRYLEQVPRPLPASLVDSTQYNTQIMWPFSKNPTAVRL